MKFTPDLLTFADGTTVADVSQWPRRREELLDILRREEYGDSPEEPAAVEGVVTGVEKKCCSGHAVLETIDLSFETETGRFTFPFHLFLPNTPGRKPLFLLINFRKDVYDMYYPAEEIVDNGFALAVVCYQDIASDDGDFSTGLAACYSRNYTWGKIGMWAFGASRMLDYLLTRPEIDGENAAVIGHSRLGKTALWCAAQDERFRFGISNDSGCGGAALEQTKHEGGETIAYMDRTFPYWFCKNRSKYVSPETEKPFDQHFLLGAIAPRYVCVGSASEDAWADPWSEQLACVAAGPAWELHGKPGFSGGEAPARVGESLDGGCVGYHLRDGCHFLGRADWLQYMKFVKERL